MRQGITRMSQNELFIVVALGWLFASFLQGVDGFGTPIAIVAPLLVAFGLKPIDADRDADEIRDEFAAMLARSRIEDAEEYAIHDHEGFEGVTIREYAG